MALYENVFIVRQDVSAQQVEDLTTRFTGLITDGGGAVTRNEYWGLRALAYKIKKNRKGHYVLLHIDAPADAVKEMERNMNLNEDVMRFMTIRVDELDEEPSVMVRSRAAREERERDRARGRGDRPRERKEAAPAAGPKAEPQVAEAKAEPQVAEAKEAKPDGTAEVAAPAAPAEGGDT